MKRIRAMLHYDAVEMPWHRPPARTEEHPPREVIVNTKYLFTPLIGFNPESSYYLTYLQAANNESLPAVRVDEPIIIFTLCLSQGERKLMAAAWTYESWAKYAEEQLKILKSLE